MGQVLFLASKIVILLNMQIDYFFFFFLLISLIHYIASLEIFSHTWQIYYLDFQQKKKLKKETCGVEEKMANILCDIQITAFLPQFNGSDLPSDWCRTSVKYTKYERTKKKAVCQQRRKKAFL